MAETVPITSHPTKAVSGLTAPEREKNGSYKFTSSWKVKDRLKATKYHDRATHLIETFIVAGADGKNPFKCGVSVLKGISDTAASFNLNNFTDGDGKHYTRQSFYPYTSKKVTSITAMVRALNFIGGSAWPSTKKAEKSRAIKTPRKPTINALEFNKSGTNGIVSTTVNTNAGEDYNERARTRVVVAVEDTMRKRLGQTWKWNSTDTYTTSTAYAASYDAGNYQGMDPDNDYIKVTVSAYAQGLAGDSATVTATPYYIAYPAQATIKSIDVTSRDEDGKVNINIATNATGIHPVDQVVLEYLENTEYMTANDIPATEQWTVSNIKDNGKCEWLSISNRNLIPQAGHRTWVRVRSWHADEGVLYRYSKYAYLEALETPAPSATASNIVITEAQSAANGEGAEITMAWNADGLDESTGTELSWDENPNAWRSTDQPDTFEFTFSDGALTHGGTTYQDSATINIAGLHEGTVYYVRARRYLELNGDITYSAYSNTEAVMPSVAPSDVVLDMPSFLPDGSGIPVTWTYGGGGTQSEWQLIDGAGAVIVSDTGTAGGYTIGYADALEHMISGVLTVHVEVSTGSGFVASDALTLAYVPAPTLVITVPATLTAQPFSFTANSSAASTLTVAVFAQGADGQTPTGVRLQPSGTVIWSGIVEPLWTLTNGVFTASVPIPADRDFLDGAAYTVEVTATDPATGLQSPTVSADFAVVWAHQAPSIDDYVTVQAVDYIDNDDYHHQEATITLTTPVNSASTDVYDIYRLTADNAELIGEGLPLEYVVTDEYAPFGDGAELAYRVAIRTVDGDFEFTDVGYELTGNAMRIDFSGGSLELPNDIVISNGYAKDADIRKHADGESTAYYNEGVDRSASLSTNIIRIYEAETERLLHALANDPATAFVRLPDGSAYEADVQVSNASTSGVLLEVSLSARQVRTTGAYMLPEPTTDETEGE